MKDDNTSTQQSNTGADGPEGSTRIETDNKKDTSSDAKSKAQKQQKWSLRRHWDQASYRKRAAWIGAGIIGGITVLSFVSNLYGNWQQARSFQEESRPRLVISRPPELIGDFTCQVTDRAIHFNAGPLKNWVKNNGRGTAINAFGVGPMFQLVPDVKTGYPIVDNAVVINDDSCKSIKQSASTRIFPVHGGGEEVSEQMRGEAGITSLINTRSVTIGKEPEPPLGEGITQKIPITRDSKFRLYAPICVYYFDKDGKQWGTCQTYIFNVSGRPDSSDSRIFSCTETPLKGTFEQVFGNYCDE